MRASRRLPAAGLLCRNGLSTGSSRSPLDESDPGLLRATERPVRLHIGPSIGAQRLAKLQPEQVEAMYGQMLASGLSASSVLRTHRILSRALKVAMQRGKITRNVCTLVDPPTPKRSESSPLTVDEARRVLNAAQDVRNPARWTVALALGLRQSDALGLAWSDVDLAGGTLSVRLGLHRVSGKGLVFEEPKSARSRRTLALPAQLVDGLRLQRLAQDREREVAGTEWQGQDFAFAQANGRPLDRRSDWEHWRARLTSAGVRRVRLHDGRHTAATLLLTAGVHRGSSWNCPATPRCARPPTSTATLCQPSPGKPPSRWGRPCWGPDRN